MSDEETTFEPVDGEELDDVAEDAKVSSKLAKLKAELATTQKEKGEYLDGWQRAKADYVNVLKRVDEEKQSSFTKGLITASGPLIDVLDAIDRAEAQGHVSPDFEPIVKQLRKAAETLNLASFGEMGDAFDPALHEALGEDEVSDKKLDHTLTAVLQKGWKYADTVLRPARVRVATLQV